MQCPHCLVEIHADFSTSHVTAPHGFIAKNVNGQQSRWRVLSMICPVPECEKAILHLAEFNEHNVIRSSIQIVPMSMSRPPPPPEVPGELAEDYIEACGVLSASPKASAALSRRCLQGILRSNGFIDKDLAPAIQAAIASKQLPSLLATSLDAVRNIGNFAAHPMKDTSTGLVLPVEPEEAEWNLDVLEGLFDYFYVLPAREQEKIDELNKKLAAAGKPPIKKT